MSQQLSSFLPNKEQQRVKAEDELTLWGVTERYRMLEHTHVPFQLNAFQLENVITEMHELGFLCVEKTTKRGDRGLLRAISLGMDRDDIVYALRDDDVAVRVFGRQFYAHD